MQLQKVTYLLTTYICADAEFLPNVWACKIPSLQRTKNMCQSFHSRFNAAFYTPHPDLFTFIERLKEFQIETYIQIQSLNIKNEIRNSYCMNQRYVQQLIDHYDEGVTSHLRFIQQFGYYLCPTPGILVVYTLTHIFCTRVQFTIICVQSTPLTFHLLQYCVQLIYARSNTLIHKFVFENPADYKNTFRMTE